MLEIGQWIGIGPLVGWLGRAIYISNQKQNSAFPFHPEAALSQLFPAAQSRHRTAILIGHVQSDTPPLSDSHKYPDS